MMEYGKKAHKNGYSVIIAGAGGAAHLPWNDCINYTTASNWCSC
jgi:phosphoribosylcarboxyaminoimidazole (NCAIR) mutase